MAAKTAIGAIPAPAPACSTPTVTPPTTGLGDDARYLIDRMALAPRMALSADATLPAAIRLDIALTSFARAVLLHDDAATDRMAAALQTLLPALAADFAAIPESQGRRQTLRRIHDLSQDPRPAGGLGGTTSAPPAT